MKSKIMMLFISIAILLTTSACYKTYACKCTYEGSTDTYTTGQVKALSKNKAEKRCSGSCSGGIVSVK
ncbi:MAG: hypothetical protein V4677_09300 [Bacteroidota bacterium]